MGEILLKIAFGVQLFAAGPIHTDDRLVVTEMSPSDKADFVRIMTDRDILDPAMGLKALDTKLAESKFAHAVEETPGWFDGIIENMQSKRPELYGFKLSSLLGKQTIGFMVLEKGPDGYWETTSGILKSFRGGTGTASRTAITAYAFEKLGLDGLRSRVQETNPASVRVTEKLGFMYVGRSTKDGDPVPGTWLDYRLSKDTYFHGRALGRCLGLIRGMVTAK